MNPFPIPLTIIGGKYDVFQVGQDLKIFSFEIIFKMFCTSSFFCIHGNGLPNKFLL